MGKQLDLEQLVKTVTKSAATIPPAGSTATLVSNGHELIAMPADDLRKVEGFKMMGEDDFDWSRDDSIVLNEQPATAVYENTAGDIVIRQARAWDREDDTICVIAKQNLQVVIDKLCDLAGIGSAP